MTITSYGIGTTSANIVSLDDLAAPLTRATYQPYTEPVKLANGLVRGAGLPRVEWFWNLISSTQRAALRAYCSGASAEVFIWTKTDDETFKRFSAIMIWPPTETRSGDPRLNYSRSDFAIEFTNLVEVP